MNSPSPTQASTCIGRECRFTNNKTAKHLLEHIRQNIPTKILYSEASILPTREDFLDPTETKTVAKQIASKVPLYFLPTSLNECHEYLTRNESTFAVQLFGVLTDGSKACVTVRDIPVYFDIKVPSAVEETFAVEVIKGEIIKNNATKQFEAEVRAIITSNMPPGKATPVMMFSSVDMFPLHGFSMEKHPYLRVHFKNIFDRAAVIKIARLNGWETASDDSGFDAYIPKVARENKFKTCGWNMLSNYTPVAQKVSHCKYEFTIGLKDIVKVPKAILAANPAFERDSTMINMWDIETYRKVQNGQVPFVGCTDYTIFCISSAFAWHHNAVPMLTVCAIDMETEAHEGVSVMVECSTEKQVLELHARANGLMRPEILGAYNGGNFDWPLYLERVFKLDLKRALWDNFSSIKYISPSNFTNMRKKYFTDERVKLSAEDQHKMDVVAKFPGLLDTDVMAVFLRMYPRNETRKAGSLNAFLARNNLPSKEDMPYIRMFRFYERAKDLKQARRMCHCDLLVAQPNKFPDEALGGLFTDAPCTAPAVAPAVAPAESCFLCAKFVRDVDNVVRTEPNPKNPDDLYFDERRPELTPGKCCYCTKRPLNKRDMADVGYYCVIDCVRPQQLYVKCMVVPDKRELANLSFLPLYDSFFRADGNKVCNLIAAYCYPLMIAFSNRKIYKKDHEKDHYPGGYVFHPIRGLNNKRPITGLDFASLYPSLMMAYNLSPDMIIKDPQEAKRLTKLGYVLHKIGPFNYEVGEEKHASGNIKKIASGWTVRHNGAVMLKGQSSSAITIAGYEANYVAKTADGSQVKWRVGDPAPAEGLVGRRQVLEPIIGRETLPGERMGIFPFVLKKLFDKRVPIKAELGRLGYLRERMLKNGETTTIIDGVEMDLETDIEFKISKVDAKQKAIKTLSNTFYGKSGDFRCALYEILVAAGTTTAGQFNIKFVADYVMSLGYSVQYGDTDSLYLTCPDRYYAAADKKYAADLLAIGYTDDVTALNGPRRDEVIEIRREYWTEMVTITMRVMTLLTEEVAKMLMENNNTLFLKMAYEEVGFPTVLCGKKKYFMTEHKGTVNFNVTAKTVFIRGIDIIKQGQTNIAKTLGNEFMLESLHIGNTRELLDIAYDKVKKYFSLNLPPSEYSQVFKYKPDKQNVAVHVFVQRMADRCARTSDPAIKALYEPPSPGDPFRCVIVKKANTTDYAGRKISPSKGEKMEYLSAFLARPGEMELDISYYMLHGIAGILGRFVVYHSMFQPPAGKLNIDTEYEKVDKFCVKAVKSHLGKYCEQFITGDGGFAAASKRHKSAYRTYEKAAKAAMDTSMSTIYANTKKKQKSAKVSKADTTAALIFVAAKNRVAATVIAPSADFGTRLVERYGRESIQRAQEYREVNQPMARVIRMERLKAMLAAAEGRIAASARVLAVAAGEREKACALDLINIRDAATTADIQRLAEKHSLKTPEEIEAFAAIDAAVIRMIGLNHLVANAMSIHAALLVKKVEVTGIADPPTNIVEIKRADVKRFTGLPMGHSLDI